MFTLRVSWLLVAGVPALLMLAALGLGRLESELAHDPMAVADVDDFLERAGLVSAARDAQRRPRRLEAKPLGDASEWLEGYRARWEAQFQRLDALLSELQARKTNTHTKTKRGPTKRGRTKSRRRLP